MMIENEEVKKELKRMNAIVFGYKRELKKSDCAYLLVMVKDQQKELKELRKQKEELEAASQYIEENEVVHKKVKAKTGIPTVIEYQGQRYILDVKN